jgi:hypothetical protein
MTPEDAYREAASHALAGFQLIEASLKDYIAEFHATVRRHLPASLTYEYSRSDIEDASLGKLVNVFARMNGNVDLVRKLRKLQGQRDELAHRALTKLYGQERETFDFASNTDPLVDLANDLGYLLDDVNKEGLRLLIAREKSSALPDAAA